MQLLDRLQDAHFLVQQHKKNYSAARLHWIQMALMYGTKAEITLEAKAAKYAFRDMLREAELELEALEEEVAHG